MAKKQSRAKPSKKKTKISSPRRNIIIAVILIGLGVLFGGTLIFNVVIAPPTATEESQGYMVFYIQDQQTGELLDGEIMLFAVNEYDDPLIISGYDNPIATGDIIFVDEPVIATVYNVSLKTDISRSWLPKTIAPIGSSNANAPQNNTIRINFLSDPDNVTVEIISKNGVSGTYDHADFLGDIEYELEIQFNITSSYEASVYGSYGYVPQYILNESYDLNAEYNVSGFGLWLCFNSSEVAMASVNGDEASIFYIESHYDFGMILLNPIMVIGGSEGDIQTVDFELKQNPTGMFIFEGFLEDLGITKIVIS